MSSQSSCQKEYRTLYYIKMGKRGKFPQFPCSGTEYWLFVLSAMDYILSSPTGYGATDIYRDGRTACLRSPRLSWAAYDRAMRVRITADPSFSWGHIDQEAWALTTVQSTSGPPQAAGFKRRAGTYCLKWNHSQCNYYPNCKYAHACASCHNPGQRAPSCLLGSFRLLPCLWSVLTANRATTKILPCRSLI